MNQPQPLLPVACIAERRLGRLHVWAAVRARVTVIFGAAAMGAVLRPFVWPLHHQSPALSAARALGFAAASGLVITAVIVVRAWRTRPSRLAAARKIDQELGLAEVVASGFAFERDNRDDEMALFAIDRARNALANVDVGRLFKPQPVPRPRWFRLMIALAAVGVLFGAIDRLIVERTIHPVTDSERRAAAELKATASQAPAKVDPKAAPSPQEQQMIEAAKRAAEAAERGDRKGAMEALEDMRKAERALQAEERDRAKSLRAMRDELTATKAGSNARPSTASEAVSEMQRDVEKTATKEELEKLAERLERAERGAREAAKQAANEATREALQRAADALKEAREAASRGDKEGTKRALERAMREISSLEKASKDASKGTTAKLSEQATSLDRSLRAGAEGRKPGAGNEKSDGSGKGGKGEKGDGSGAKGGKSDDKAKGEPGGPGGGGEDDDRAPVAPKDRIKINGDLQARADVKEGEKAVSVIEGMGKGGDPKAYKEIFPAYDTVVEDGLREDNVPAARRPTVRRYFRSIRPGEEAATGDEKK